MYGNGQTGQSSLSNACVMPPTLIPIWVWIGIAGVVLIAGVAIWRWYTAKRHTDRLLLDMQEMGDVKQFEEPLLSIVPEPLQPVAVLDMRGLVVDQVMIGHGAFGTASIPCEQVLCVCVRERERERVCVWCVRVCGVCGNPIVLNVSVSA